MKGLGREPDINKAIAKRAWQLYVDLDTLAQSPLASAEMCIALLWEGDTPENGVGFAVQAILQWVLERLASSSHPQVRDYAVILRARYVEKQTVELVANTFDTSPKSLKKRQSTAWGKSAEILKDEQKNQRAQTAQAHLMCQLRYEALTPEQQSIIRYLAIFERPEPLAFLNLSKQHAVDAYIAALQTANVIQVDNKRNTIVHPRFVNYVRAQIPLDEWQHWQRFAANLYPSDGDFLQTATHFQHAGNWDTAAALFIKNKEVLGEYLFGSKTSLAQWQQLLERFTAGMVSAKQISAEQWAQINILLGNIIKLTDEPLDNALVAYQQAMRSAETITTQAEIYYERGHAYQSSNVAESLFQLEQCIKLTANHKDDLTAYWHLKALLIIALVYVSQRLSMRDSLRLLQESERILDGKSGLRWLKLTVDLHNVWGEYYKYQSNADAQLHHCRQAALAADRANDPLRIVKMTYQLGGAYFAKGTAFYATSRQMLEKCNKWAVQIQYDVMCGKVQSVLGALAFAESADFKQSLNHYKLARNAFERAGDNRSFAAMDYNIAEALLELGEIENAIISLAEGRTLATSIGNKSLIEYFEPRLRKKYPESADGLRMQQRFAIRYVRMHGQITKGQYCKLTKRSEKQAVRELNELVEKGIFGRFGKGRGTAYRIITQ
ncbi:MAG: hypothetical protein ACPG8W_04805 [Candidatus Promineifilaceae bacterium]